MCKEGREYLLLVKAFVVEVDAPFHPASIKRMAVVVLEIFFTEVIFVVFDLLLQIEDSFLCQRLFALAHLDLSERHVSLQQLCLGGKGVKVCQAQGLSRVEGEAKEACSEDCACESHRF